MFTGIITDLGRVRAIEARGDSRFVIETSYPATALDIGASVACSGVCLTVVDKGSAEDANGGTSWFAVDVSAETLSCTNLGAWAEGTRVNLERSLRLGDEMGGHIVSGHVDGVAEVQSVTSEGDSKVFAFSVPPDLARYVAAKGSLALDGVSLTVNAVEGDSFTVNIIPHTQQVTSFADLKPGGKVNLEVDLLARYVARLTEGN